MNKTELKVLPPDFSLVPPDAENILRTDVQKRRPSTSRHRRSNSMQQLSRTKNQQKKTPSLGIQIAEEEEQKAPPVASNRPNTDGTVAPSSGAEDDLFDIFQVPDFDALASPHPEADEHPTTFFEPPKFFPSSSSNGAADVVLPTTSSSSSSSTTTTTASSASSSSTSASSSSTSASSTSSAAGAVDSNTFFTLSSPTMKGKDGTLPARGVCHHKDCTGCGGFEGKALALTTPCQFCGYAYGFHERVYEKDPRIPTKSTIIKSAAGGASQQHFSPGSLSVSTTAASYSVTKSAPTTSTHKAQTGGSAPADPFIDLFS